MITLLMEAEMSLGILGSQNLKIWDGFSKNLLDDDTS